MSFPPLPLEWATDDDYAAGADPWSGAPTKVAPTASQKTKGFIPETPASAQAINYLLNGFAELANAAILRSVTDFSPVATETSSFTSGWTGHGDFFNRRNRAWYRPNGAADNFRVTQNFGGQWRNFSVGAIGWTFPRGGANNNPLSAQYGDMLFGQNTATIRKYDYAGASFANVTLPVAPSGVVQFILHDPVNSTWVVGSDNGAAMTIQNAPDTTYVFTDRSGGVPAHTSTVRAFAKISDTGVILIPTDEALGLGDAGAVLRSADGGTTWTKVTLPSSMWHEQALAWIPGRQEWVYQGAEADGKPIYASADGITWTLRSATNPIDTLTGGTGGFFSFASIGSVLWASWLYDDASSTVYGSMAYSLDGGATWGLCSNLATDGDSASGRVGRGVVTAGDDSVMVTALVDPASQFKGVAFLRNVKYVTYADLP